MCLGRGFTFQRHCSSSQLQKCRFLVKIFLFFEFVPRITPLQVELENWYLISRKKYPGFWPNSRRWLTSSWKPAIQNFVTLAQRGMELWVLKVRYSRLFVPLACRSNTTYIRLPGGWKVADSENRHISLDECQLKLLESFAFQGSQPPNSEIIEIIAIIIKKFSISTPKNKIFNWLPWNTKLSSNFNWNSLF